MKKSSILTIAIIFVIRISSINAQTASTFTDLRDGQTYPTIKIDNQTWFAKNLNYKTSSSWCYDNSNANSNIYGRLYTWDASLKACPRGWHLPSDDEWKTLEMALGMGQSDADDKGWRGTDEGDKIKETGFTHWYSSNTGSTNSSGFTALPGGYRTSNGLFRGLVHLGHWWSSTEASGTRTWRRHLYDDKGKVYRSSSSKSYGYSVRCLKD